MCGFHGVTPSHLTKAAARERVYDSEEGVPYKRALVKIATHIYDSLGDTTSVGANLYQRLDQAPQWHASFDAFVDPVRYAVSSAVRLHDDHVVKEANLLLPIAAAQGKLGETSKLLLGAGASGGILGGALAHMLVRNARQTSANNAGLEAKILLYKQLRRDIEEDLDTSGALETESKDDEDAIAKSYEL